MEGIKKVGGNVVGEGEASWKIWLEEERRGTKLECGSGMDTLCK